MTDDELEPQLREWARTHNEPPETPREAMWARIDAARRAKRDGAPAGGGILPFATRAARRSSVWAGWGVGIAAAVALAFGLGRWSAPADSDAPRVVAAEATPERSDVAYRLAATEHLGQTETFLTLFRASLRSDSPGNERIASATARQLLSSNRMLLDSRAADDPRTRLLLEDLELVLAQIAQLSPGSRSEDVELIEDGLDQGDVLTRIRAAVPAGSGILSRQGAL